MAGFEVKDWKGRIMLRFFYPGAAGRRKPSRL